MGCQFCGIEVGVVTDVKAVYFFPGLNEFIHLLPDQGLIFNPVVADIRLGVVVPQKV
jgi:hypothetical protein